MDYIYIGSNSYQLFSLGTLLRNQSSQSDKGTMMFAVVHENQSSEPSTPQQGGINSGNEEQFDILV